MELHGLQLGYPSQAPDGWSVIDEGAQGQFGISTYVQSTVKIRNLLGVGGVTGYTDGVTSSFGSLHGREIIGMIKSLASGC